jgi:acetyltransferase-like isoleucine patch superfamily enzyme
MGFRTRYDASHRKLGKSKLFVSADAQLTAASTNGSAIVGPCSVLHVDSGEFSMVDSYIHVEANILRSESMHIGIRCAITWGVKLSDSNFHSLTVDGKEKTKAKPFGIEDHVWIGNNVNYQKKRHYWRGGRL